MSVKELCICAGGMALTLTLGYTITQRRMFYQEVKSILSTEVLNEAEVAAVLNVLLPATPGR